MDYQFKNTKDEKSVNERDLIIYCKHEHRLKKQQQYIDQLWSLIFHETPVINTNLIVGTRLTPNLTQEMIASTLKPIPHTDTNNESSTNYNTSVNQQQKNI
ncbi:unnamed protein product [Rotaria magnacalcarata]|uniref:Uncharacterized protein n=1 Tax=Rotaria magnacalcarata TaxID=392030 RepID=A0A815FQ75_9BILA|nr:unnamed protein product [Rotaria magnacalcarata]CAF2107075.1 unnamed protein product [Rotaria magnacalcarata]CAF4197796.1 unnamed protein product [Rotaria magnacalcarata]